MEVVIHWLEGPPFIFESAVSTRT